MDARSTRDETYAGSATPAYGDAAGVTPWQPERWPITAPQATTADLSYFDGYGSRNYGSSCSRYATMGSAQGARWVRPIWLSGLLFLLAVVQLATYFVGGSSNASPRDPTSAFVPTGVFTGVNICAQGDINYVMLGCAALDPSVAAKSGAMLCYSTLDDGTFASPKVSFAVQRLGPKGKPLARGTSNDTVTPAESSSCTDTDAVIHNAMLTLTPGSYAVEVHNGSTDLGSTTFTLTAATR
jgi:hypothetical protein